jgi:beta-ureidopropionase / N-carbamoyl-L-amino-acid hydrolase
VLSPTGKFQSVPEPDIALAERLFEILAMDRIDVPRCEMACGAGHDAAVFSGTGFSTLMLLVRNQNGSHNPDEAMGMADFAVVTRLLAQGIARVS